MRHPVALNAGYNTTSPQTVLEVCAKLPKTVPGTVITAIVAGVVLVMVKLLNEKLRRKLPLPIPGELLTVRVPGDGGQGRRASEGTAGQYTTSRYLRATWSDLCKRSWVLEETAAESPVASYHP